jgi:hypothetical protein
MVVNVEKDLTLEFIQDQDKEEEYRKSNSYSGGFGYSGYICAGCSGGVSGDYAHSYGENFKESTQGAYIKSDGKLVIRVGGTTSLKGSTISSESGETDITTKSLIYEDMTNSENAIEDGKSISVGLGKNVLDGTISVGYRDKENIKEGVTRATIGKGKLTVLDGSGEGINRDEEKTEEARRDERLKAGDCVLTLDTRLFSSGGRKEIKEQIKVKEIWNNLLNIRNGVVEKGEQTGQIVSNIYKLIVKGSKDGTEIASRIVGTNGMYEAVMDNKKLSQIEKENILRSPEIEKLALTTRNLEKVEKYISENKIDEQTAKKLRQEH